MTHEMQAFFDNADSLACYEVLWNALSESYPKMECKVQKTQISFYEKRMFCCVSLPRKKADAGGIIVSFFMDAPIPDARIRDVVEPYPGRWTHHVVVRAPEEIDGQLLAWIDWAHSFKAGRRCPS